LEDLSFQNITRTFEKMDIPEEISVRVYNLPVRRMILPTFSHETAVTVHRPPYHPAKRLPEDIATCIKKLRMDGTYIWK
jgi:hypothetical protein